MLSTTAALPEVGAAEDVVQAKFGEFLRVRPTAPLVAAVQGAGFRLNGRPFDEDLEAGADLRVGTHVLAVIELRGKGATKQWMLAIRHAEASNPTGASAEADPDSVRPQLARVFSSTGRRFEFPSERLAMAFEVFGPVELSERGSRQVEKHGVKQQDNRRWVSEGFLRLGFADFAEAWVNLRESGVAVAPGLGTQLRPYPEDLAAKVAGVAERAGWSEENDRAFSATMPALIEFVTLILRTPAMAEIFWEVTDVPWLAVMKKRGKLPSINFQFQPEGVRHLTRPSDEPPRYREFYVVPFELKLEGKTALEVALVVRNPRGALVLTAGVVALEARDPRDPARRVLVRLVGASERENRSDDVADAP